MPRLGDPNYDGDWDLVGFTGMTCEIPHVYQMADEFRKRGKTVVIGGYHATALPEEAAKHADIVVVGEAEGFGHKSSWSWRTAGRSKGIIRTLTD